MPESTVDGEALFACRMCGECCRGFGGTVVTAEDIEAIAAFIGVSMAETTARYCRPSGRKQVLGQKDDGFCAFFDKRCAIHPVKPRMCRQWPFIEGVIRNPANWRVMASCCPGMNAEAPVAQVLERVKEELDREEDAKGRREKKAVISGTIARGARG